MWPNSGQSGGALGGVAEHWVVWKSIWQCYGSLGSVVVRSAVWWCIGQCGGVLGSKLLHVGTGEYFQHRGPIPPVPTCSNLLLH